jgi:hypothetical protein
MKKILGVLVCLFVLLSLNSALAAVTTISLHDQFPDVQGQNGFYAYGYQDGREIPYRELERGGPYYFYTPEQDYNIPYWEKSDSPWLTTAPSASDQTGTVFGPENAVLAWRAPQTNTYALTGQFRLHPEFGIGPVTVYLRRNNETPFWSAILDFLDQNAADFNLPSVSLKAGDMLYFGVDAGTEDYNDTTQLSGEISYTPRDAAGAACSLLLLD